LAASAGQRLAALGVGVPGLADFHRGRTLFLPNLPTGWRDYPLADRLSAAVGCPVFLLNDARMAALGELWFGQGRGAKTMVVITVGTGIGGGVVIDRKLRLGPLEQPVRSGTRLSCRTVHCAGAATGAAWRPLPEARLSSAPASG